MMPKSWEQKVVLITGASSGIGRSLAVELGKRGASVGLLARRADALRELVAEIEQANGRALALPADVRDGGAVRASALELQQRFGPIDVLIANAGIATTGHITEMSGEVVSDVMSINVVGAANSVAAVLPEMVARRSGHLVAISSLSAYRGLPKSAVYCASKAALSAYFESVRVDLRGTGVEVSIIHPGFIKTPLTAGRKAEMPFLMELPDATRKIIGAIEARRKSFAFPWQLASIVRAAMLFPIPLYDRIVSRRSYRE
jgi:short-subunit dehydrogenase